MSHGIGRAGMTGEIPATEKVETQDRDGRNDQLGAKGPVERNESAGMTARAERMKGQLRRIEEPVRAG